MNSSPELSIVTVNYNGLKDTCELIESLKRNIQSLTYEIIIVDNASSVDEALSIHTLYPDIITIRSEKNLGFAGGNNLGMKQAQGDYIFLINNDTYIEEDCIPALINRLKSNDKIGMVCPLLRYTEKDRPIQFYGYTPLTPITLRNKGLNIGEIMEKMRLKAHATPYAHGAAMLFGKDLLKKVGYMPEIYFLYYEELDWSVQITKAGYEIWVEPACTVFHKESQSTGKESPLRCFYMTRNRLLFAKRNRKGIIRLLACIYQIFLVAVRNCLRYGMKKRMDLVKATLKGIVAFFKL